MAVADSAKAVPFRDVGTRKVVFPLKADYYIVYATTEETVGFVNRLSR